MTDVDLATPRPWQRSQTDDGYWEIRSHGDGIERALVEHVALFPIERDAQLTTDAVNSYDRLRAAARELANEAARAVTEPRRFHENEDDRQRALGRKIAALRLALDLAATETEGDTGMKPPVADPLGQQVRPHRDPAHLASEVVRQRARRSWTASGLASRAGLSKSYLSSIEAGTQSNPSIDVIFRIAGAFGITVSDLLFPDPRVEMPPRCMHDDVRTIRVCLDCDEVLPAATEPKETPE